MLLPQLRCLIFLLAQILTVPNMAEFGSYTLQAENVTEGLTELRIYSAFAQKIKAIFRAVYEDVKSFAVEYIQCFLSCNFEDST